MSTEIKDAFTENFPLTIDQPIAKGIIRYVQGFEVKGYNAAAFNSPYLAMPSPTFTTEDRDGFFNLLDTDSADVAKFVNDYTRNNKIFGITRNQYRSILDTITRNAKSDVGIMGVINLSRIRSVISSISTVDKNFKVVSDPFNLFSTYVTSCILSSKLPEAIKYEAAFKTIMLLQYKFFCSIVHHRFIYAPDQDAMRATYEKLSGKFAIRQYGTWKAVMEARAHDTLSDSSLHYKSLSSGEPDDKLLYFITDTQTRIRSQVNIFTEEFMKTKEENDSLGNYSSMGSDSEGTKVLIDRQGSYEHIFNNVYQDTMSLPRFSDSKAMLLLSNMFKAINTPMLQRLITYFSDYCVKCAMKNATTGIKMRNGQVVYMGGYDIVVNTLQCTYHYCINSKVNMSNPRDILLAARDAYSSSRISDEGILKIKNTMDMIVQDANISSRDATRASLRISLVLYLVIISFRYI